MFDLKEKFNTRVNASSITIWIIKSVNLWVLLHRFTVRYRVVVAAVEVVATRRIGCRRARILLREAVVGSIPLQHRRPVVVVARTPSLVAFAGSIAAVVVGTRRLDGVAVASSSFAAASSFLLLLHL